MIILFHVNIPRYLVIAIIVVWYPISNIRYETINTHLIMKQGNVNNRCVAFPRTSWNDIKHEF